MQTRGPPPNVTRAKGGACPPPSSEKRSGLANRSGSRKTSGSRCPGDGVAHLRPRRDVVPGEVERFQHPSRGLAHGGLQAPGLGHGVVQHAHPAQGLQRDLPVPGIPSVPGGRSDSSSACTRARYGRCCASEWGNQAASVVLVVPGDEQDVHVGQGAGRRKVQRHGRGTAPASPARPWGGPPGGAGAGCRSGAGGAPADPLHPRQALPEIRLALPLWVPVGVRAAVEVRAGGRPPFPAPAPPASAATSKVIWRDSV